jgi:fructose 1,6-bisphosphate aldolase/phosphatase
MRVTFSVIKADVGSIGGHTKPSEIMMQTVREMVQSACFGQKRILIDGLVTHTGDDIALIMSHRHGVGSEVVHKFAWDCFLAATEVAKKQGLYGAGQDLLVDAPSGTIRGAGPAVAEIEFDRDPTSKDRPAEAILVLAADKCSPGAYNYPLYTAFCDPMHNGGLLLNPRMRQGFTFTIIDMDYRYGDRVIKLDVPERIWDVAVLLQNPDRFAVEAIHSRYKPDEQIVSVSATRLHNIAGKYTGKDDPVAIVRTQGIFPAPEEVIEPYLLGHFVVGDARGSHVMPVMPVAINTPVTGPFCLPLVSCLAFSMDAHGRFSQDYVDMFGNAVWDQTRLKVQQKADEWRRQGFIGPTMASHTELSYTGIVDTLEALSKEFFIRE